jgi:cell wall-associated NlpC family hydrolase
MLRLWRTTAVVLAVAMAVTGCAGGMGGRGAEGTEAGEMAGGITGKSTAGRSGVAEAPGRQNGAASGNGQASFGPNAVGPLNQRGGANVLDTNGKGNHDPVTVPYVTQGKKRYVSLDTIVELLQFENYEVGEEPGVREIGDKDVMFRLEAGSKLAEKEGAPFQLAEAPKMIKGKMMLSATAAADLFAEEMVFEATKNGLRLYPSDTNVEARDTDGRDTTQVDESLDFADDPNDPFKGEEAEGVFSSTEEAEAALEALEAIAADPEAVPVLKNININDMIRTSKKYIGVRYKFGAKPYPVSKRFDCSSYTQYVFGKYGVKLPRTARQQIEVGRTVSRKSLRKGDLLFFYVPGRFKSNKVAGHVGIYIGNRKMIHANTEPINGVHIRSIDRAFWKETFLKAKRVAY